MSGRFQVRWATALCALVAAVAAHSAQALQAPTTTTLTQEQTTKGQVYTVSVAGGTTTPSGVVTLRDSGQSLGSAQLDASGSATITVDKLSFGKHSLVAVYSGDTESTPSFSQSVATTAADTTASDFTFAVGETAVTVQAGQSAATALTITPENGFSQYVSFSCSGASNGVTVALPTGLGCSFTPKSVNATGDAVNVTLNITTVGSTGEQSSHLASNSALLACGLMLPLAGFLAWRMRRIRTAQILAIAFFAMVAMAGISGCSQRYSYYNRQPADNAGTPAGVYDMVVTASSENGVTATSHTVQVAVTVTN